MSGKTTVADMAARVAADIGIKHIVPWALVVILGIYAFWQRKLRMLQIQTDAAERRELEKRIDTGRSSSHLTADGRTNPADRE